MHWIIQTVLHTHPKQIVSRILFYLNGKVLTFSPSGTPRGRVLLSYITRPFTSIAHNQLDGHTNYWEVKDMVATFLERGYIVDVIDFHNIHFVPKYSYDIFIDVAGNMGRISPLLPAACKKIFFATGSFSAFQNNAELERLTSLKVRRGVALAPRRQIVDMGGVAYADIISGVCGAFPTSTYEQFGKPIHMIPVSSSHTFAFPSNKNYTAVKTHFLWFGGAGAVHKGLDLVLEAFASMPEYSLTICGKFAGEEDFVNVYQRELYETSNIHPIGYIDPGSTEFIRICTNTIGVVSLSCSEGTASSIILAMHAGLLPIVNKETGVEVGEFGILLPDSDIETLKLAIRDIASSDPETLKMRSNAAWRYVQEHHTREQFGRTFRTFIDSIILS